jgi:hypothetical protein
MSAGRALERGIAIFREHYMRHQNETRPVSEDRKRFDSIVPVHVAFLGTPD